MCDSDVQNAVFSAKQTDKYTIYTQAQQGHIYIQWGGEQMTITWRVHMMAMAEKRREGDGGSDC